MTGTTALADRADDGTPADGDDSSGYNRAWISGDGRTVAFTTIATNLLGPGGDGQRPVGCVRHAGSTPLIPLVVDALLFPDGALDDIVLEIVDAATGAVTTQCPAGDVTVAGSNAAYLRPESSDRDGRLSRPAR